MLLISIDTSGRQGSVALCRGEKSTFETLQLITLEGGTYSARLMPAIAELLTSQQVSKEQIDAFVVVSGPGSFTGLRVGIATVKALCEVLQKPLVAVSMLEAVAVVRGRGNGRVAVALDAGRGEVYVGEFKIANSQATVAREYIAKLDVFARESASTDLAVLSPDSNIIEAMRTADGAARQVQPLRADEIGRFGRTKLLAGEVADPATLDANYIRRSEAEIFAAPKHKRC
jgi:tRNA threonylcarbamoyladenosine biosynthesis protein TsaB